MCLIVDANVASIVFGDSGKTDFSPVRKALLAGKAFGVYGGKLAREYKKLGRLRGLIREYDRKGALRKISDTQVDQATQKLERTSLCKSDDAHIIALARVSGVRLLCSHDKDLHRDFTNPRLLSPAGSVYQKPRHSDLIRQHCHASTSRT